MPVLWTVAALGMVVSGYAHAADPVNADNPPMIPVGLDAYRMWDRWAYLRIGQRAYMTSTYDRRGGNEAADAGHFLYQLADDRNVTLDVMGPGVLVFARYNHWHGSPWHYVVDGRDFVVKETSTADPLHPTENSVFIPAAPFPNPLTWTWSHTKGADLMWVPLPFERSFTMAYERTHYGTGYYIYHKFAPGMTNLSRPIKGWMPEDVPSQNVLDLIARSGTNIGPAAIQGSTRTGVTGPGAGNTVELPAITNGPGVIRRLQFHVDQKHALALGRARLRIYWDGNDTPSVDAPMAPLFGAGTLYNRDNKEYLVKAFPVSIQFRDGRVYLNMYFPMPFMKSARIQMTAPKDSHLNHLGFHIRFQRYTDPANWVGHFHATYVDHGEPTPGKDLVLLDTTKVEGGGDWCGHFVGTSFIFSDRAVLNTLEGDPRFFFDDSSTPQAQGTGTEEWGGGGDYWGGRTMTLPFAGHPVGAKDAKSARCDEDKIESAYRFLLADLMPFGRNARIQLEHGGENNSTEHYRSVTYWYGLHQPCLKLTDTFHVGDTADEAKHEYVSPSASPVQTVTSRYEWGLDHLNGKEIYPETTDTGRYMTGTSTFTLKLDPNNVGVLLRRKMDYSFPNQCARVFLADVTPARTEPRAPASGPTAAPAVRSGIPGPWYEVGYWFTAGSNTVVYSNPKGELGATQHNVQTSNRRWRDDEFLLPPASTKGRESIRIRTEFVPRDIPVYPGHPLPLQAWSEYRYTAYCYVMPRL
jgi:hypothetical protein